MIPEVKVDNVRTEVLALVDTGNLVKGNLVSSEFWKMIGGKMLEESNARVNMAEKGGKGLRV